MSCLVPAPVVGYVTVTRPRGGGGARRCAILFAAPVFFAEVIRCLPRKRLVSAGAAHKFTADSVQALAVDSIAKATGLPVHEDDSLMLTGVMLGLLGPLNYAGVVMGYLGYRAMFLSTLPLMELTNYIARMGRVDTAAQVTMHRLDPVAPLNPMTGTVPGEGGAKFEPQPDDAELIRQQFRRVLEVIPVEGVTA